MSYLLHVTRLKSAAVGRGATPLLVEYDVSPETAPYLVSSTTAVMWVDEPHPNDIVKAAVRATTLSVFFAEIVEAVMERGRRAEWGNVHPLTRDGITDAIRHVSSYDLSDLELLVPRRHVPGKDPISEDLLEEGEPASSVSEMVKGIGLPVHPTSWLAQNRVVVVPRDRGFVGLANLVTPKLLTGVVHNAARGIGIAAGPSA